MMNIFLYILLFGMLSNVTVIISCDNALVTDDMSSSLSDTLLDFEESLVKSLPPFFFQINQHSPYRLHYVSSYLDHLAHNENGDTHLLFLALQEALSYCALVNNTMNSNSAAKQLFLSDDVIQEESNRSDETVIKASFFLTPYELNGDVLGNFKGNFVNTINGYSAKEISTLVASATSDCVPNALMKRDALGSFCGAFNGQVLDTTFAILDATDTTKKINFDVQGSPNTETTITSNPTANRSFILPDVSGTALVSDVISGMVFINATGPLHGSNSGIQYSSTFPSRAQIRLNQYGNNIGVPGVSTFKSRGLTIGSLAPVQPGDVIFRDTAVGVTSNLSIPLSGMISINVPPAGVPAGQGYIATEYELQLVSLDGPVNGRRVVFKITSEGSLQLLESTSAGSHTTVPSGVVALGAAGTVTVAHSKIPANARILLTIQPGPAPTGTVYVSNITANTSFTITSTAGAGDVGLNVYYQVYIPLA